ncbi:hypothetical protein [uncultured Desulfobacter sp.]|uniref:hypothetical protein n=1 Tax=uncultured Desulfobacter sp. TaxID=240139 RepID=UPI002AA932A6|nr:hypothetical protein [uncultured Desulfobacter sp.]
MKYFLGITHIDQAKQRYRKLAKQLHPDAGGTAFEFHELQTEYKEFLLGLQKEQKVLTPSHKGISAENELVKELVKLAKILIEKQVPQNYLRHSAIRVNSVIAKRLISNVINFLNEI